MKKNLLLFALVPLLVVGTTLVTNHFTNKGKKIAYVKADVLFNDFVMTKELRPDYDNTINARKELMDSLAVVLRMAVESGNQALKEKAEKQYYAKAELFDQQNEELTRKFDDQVWLRINQYVKEFGEKKGIDFLLGANGSGSLMYSPEGNDLTKELLEFMNRSYKGN